jgi:anti-anti-sigma factor
MDPHRLTVTTEQAPGAAIVHVVGDVSAMNIDAFRSGIAEAIAKKPGKVVIDLAQTTFLSSPGLAVLVQALQLSQRGGCRLVLAGANERVRGIFEIARLTEVFSIVPTVEEAVAG